ncbi:trafficking protein particle complex subunit 9-like isoform X2 [Apostichopus japonicus]|uniref:trafficking protein particle complex subunit 9-like isoform X2 n=1 Tax=Stichopus japonicus TaxID=307972 RepID=UPI003AB6A348
MSIADYNQRAEDHQSLLVLIKPFGQPKGRSFSRVMERIMSVTYVPPPHPEKHVWLRYKRIVHVENSDWGEFQGHRRITGLICLGKASSEIELANVYANYKTLKDKYNSSLYDSRCFVFGMLAEEAEKTSNGVPAGVFLFENVEECEQLEDRVKDFGSSLFWVLESKRLERLKDRSDKLPLLMVPFEKKDMVGIDTESRNFKRKVQGRMKKHLADLTLMAGMTQEAFGHYQTALEILRGANDWMWMGACLEGMCAASVIMHFPPEPSKAGLPRNASFNSDLLLHGEQERKPMPRLETVPTKFETLNGIIENCLTLDEINEKYKEAIAHYSRYTNAAIIVLEASIKATQVLIQQKKTMEAADFLQNIVYINLNVTINEKIQRYVALSRLYEMIGFHRKAAFFKRVAAMQCGSRHNTSPMWDSCHDLLLETMDGYKLKLDSRDIRKEPRFGWPALQIRLLNELVYTSRQLGDKKLAIRYLSFLLHGFHDDLSESDLAEAVSTLEAITNEEPGTHQPLCVDSGLILPPVPFTIFPTVKSFRLLPLSSQLSPHVIRRKSALLSPDTSSSPFIYSPLQTREDPYKKKSMVSFKWVAGDVCEVSMEVFNPLPFELKVGNLGFLTEGPSFDSIPASITLPCGSGIHTVSILGTPKSQGTLKITGYTTNIIGVESHCRLASLPAIDKPHILVNVVPPLPLMKVSTTLPKATQFLSLDQKEGSVSCSAYVSLMAGESCECEVKLTNSGKIPVEAIDIFLEEDDEAVQEVFTWSEQNILTQLPLEPGHHISFTLYIKAMGNFVSNDSSTPSSPVNFPTTPTPRKLQDLKQYGKSKKPPSTMFLETSYNPSFPHNFDAEMLLKIIEATLKFRYRGGEGGTEDYCRITTLLLRAEIKPSIAFMHWTTLPASDPRQFHLLLDVINATSHEVTVQYGEGNNLLLETRACKRLAITVDRFSVDGVNSKGGKPSTLRGFYQVVNELYAQQLASLVDIRWQCHALEKEGFASTAEISISESMLDNIDFCPIEWHLEMNGSSFYPHDTFHILVGETISMRVSVTPTIDAHSDTVQFEVCPFQDNCNGAVTPDISESILCVGCFQSQFQMLSAATLPSHVCTFTYLYPGHYKITLTCLQRKATDDLPDSPQDVKSGRLWRFRPPIDVIVAE